MTSEVSQIQLVSAIGMNPVLCLPPLPPKERERGGRGRERERGEREREKGRERGRE